MPPILLYDDACGLCAGTVQFVLRHDRRGTLRFAGLQGQYATALRAERPELGDIDSIVWVDVAADGRPERLLHRSDAVLEVMRYLGGWWRLAAAARVLPRQVRDQLYAWVARHRHRLPSAGASCLVLSPDRRTRFLD